MPQPNKPLKCFFIKVFCFLDIYSNHPIDFCFLDFSFPPPPPLCLNRRANLALKLDLHGSCTHSSVLKSVHVLTTTLLCSISRLSSLRPWPVLLLIGTLNIYKLLSLHFNSVTKIIDAMTMFSLIRALLFYNTHFTIVTCGWGCLRCEYN